MFLRLFLTLLLMAGLTVDFHTMSLGFGTAAYAFDDEEDEYEDDEEDEDEDDDDDGDDDFSYYMDYIADGGSSADYNTDIEGPQNNWGEDNPYTPEDESGYYGNGGSDSNNYSSSDEDCTFCGMNNVNDFVNYIESGQAARDGITGHVFTDPREFTSYASEHQNIMDAVISSGGSFDYNSCDGGDDGGDDSGYSSSGGGSGTAESGSHNSNDGDGANDSGTSQGHGNTNADANNGVANDSGASQDYGTQNQNLLQTDQERIDAAKSEIMNSNLTIKEEGYDASTNSYVFITYDVSKVEKTNVDGISVVNYEPAYGKVSVELSPRESNSENTETATPVSETPSHHSNTSSDVSNEGSNDSGSSSVNYGNGGNSSWNSGDSDNSGNNHSGNSNSWNYGNSGNSGNSGNNNSGNSGDSGSIETISADDEGEYEPTDNTPSTTEPESFSETRIGDGSSGPEVGDIYVPSLGDSIHYSYTPPGGCQLSNSCVATTMEYVNHLFGGDVNQGEYMLQYLRMHGEMLTDNGVWNSDARELFSIYFEQRAYPNLKEAIDDHAIVFSTIKEGTHSVAILGYTSSGDLIYYDPYYTEWRVADVSNFMGAYNIGVIGIK